MSNSRRTIPAAAFKARCLSLLDEVNESRETVIVTKRGRPVARLVAVDAPRPRTLRGSVRWHGDLVGSVAGDWDADR